MYKEAGASPSPAEFLAKVEAREKRSKPRDYTGGVLPLCFAAPGEHLAEMAGRPGTAPAAKGGHGVGSGGRMGRKRGGVFADGTDSRPPPSPGSAEALTDFSAAGTGKWMREWKAANGVKTCRPTSALPRRSKGGRRMFKG